MAIIKYWYDQSVRKLMVLNVRSQQRLEIDNAKQVDRFLREYNVCLADLKEVHEDIDRLGLFRKHMSV